MRSSVIKHYLTDTPGVVCLILECGHIILRYRLRYFKKEKDYKIPKKIKCDACEIVEELKQ